MGRSWSDFDGGKSSYLGPDSKCEQGNCNEPATRFSWDDGNFCSDCYDSDRFNRTYETWKKAGDPFYKKPKKEDKND